MINLTAKNIQKFQTHDGYAWSASFYLDGKKIGTASDQGFGGEMDLNINADALEKIKAHASTLPHFGMNNNIPQTADIVLEETMWDTLEQRKTKNLLKKKVLALTGGDVRQWKIPQGCTLGEVIACVLKQHPNAKVLNMIPLDEANRILHPVN